MSKRKGKQGKPAPPRAQPQQRTYTVELDRKHALDPIASISDSKNPDLAKAFIALVLSPDGQAIMAKYGFIPVAGGS